MEFNGREVLIVQPIFKEVKNNFTYEFWIKPLETHQIHQESTRGASGILGQKYVIGPGHGGDRNHVGTGISVGTNGISVYEHTAYHLPATLVYKVSIITWTHIAVVYKNKVPFIYIDGELRKKGRRSRKRHVFASGVLGGLEPYGYFVGQLRDVRLWDYSRNEEEIRADINKQLLGNEKGLIRYQEFNKTYENTTSGIMPHDHDRKIIDSIVNKKENFVIPQLISAIQQSYDDNLILSNYQVKTERDCNEPFISIIVPNYNHANFLKKRLDSIYNQTYQNFEVILMDDCSQDNSREILREYYNKFPEKTRLVFNDQNSGGVFYQWEKGMTLAEGELIWIAESDDWCTSNFLKELTKSFNDEAVMLAYCQTKFMDENGNNQIWTIQEYLNDIHKELWTHPFIISADQIVYHAWSIKNIIPNVSSALFKKPIKMELLKDKVWKGMRICGDWAFYIHLIQGGLISYTTNTTNYYRCHKNNTSLTMNKMDVYYKEHEIVSKYIKQIYKVSNESFKRQAENLKKHWINTRGYFFEEDFLKQYDTEGIKAVRKKEKPNILMASYSFSAGGGETFPIFLANILKDENYNVTFLCCDNEKRESGIQNMLRRDIPIVNNISNLQEIVVDFGIDLIHSHHASIDNTIIDILPPELDYSHVVTLHGMYETIQKERLVKMLPRLLSRTSKLIYTAEKNLNPFKELNLYNQEKFAKIGNAFYSGKVSPVNLEEIGIPSNAFVICHVSRAIPEKGWEESIETVKEARLISGQNIHLLLIGDGPEYNRLKTKAPEFIHFLGFKDNIQDYYAVSDLGYLPSRFRGESFPLVIIACLQNGKPVLASDVGEISMMLQGQNGLAGTTFSLERDHIPIKKVAEIMARYATDPLFYQESLNQVTFAAAKFSTQSLLRNYEKVYLEAYNKFGSEKR
ncbi:glycosyltransferase [Priestia megaterium]|uniref:glycosyltransferase n=1 Tax=Priestia megaterium TaxID=1404 RepID=UPI002E1FFB76|nr:glycosyltransferase [Priestia megaterium]